MTGMAREGRAEFQVILFKWKLFNLQTDPV